MMIEDTARKWNKYRQKLTLQSVDDDTGNSKNQCR